MADHISAQHRPSLQRTPASVNPHIRTTSTGSGPSQRPIPVAGLIAGRVHYGEPLGDGTVRRTLLPVPTIKGVIRRSKLDYKAGYDQGYLQRPGRWDSQGFDSGLLDGLNELVGDRLIDRQSVNQIMQNHPRVIQYPTGWDNDFERHASASEQQQDGMTAGQGMGFDQGYEEALAQYGYSRKYSVIPAANILIAQGDNGGICVYCNHNYIQDIDHVYPLKEHWRRKGATMQQADRSTEANHIRNLVGACANCNRSKGSKLLRNGWNPPAWGVPWWPFGPPRAQQYNSPGPYWPP